MFERLGGFMEHSVLKIVKKGAAFGAAYLSVWGLTQKYMLSSEGIVKPNSISAVLLLIIFLAAISWCLGHSDARARRCCIAPSAILGCCYRVGAEFYSTGHLNLKNWELYFGILVLSFVFWMVIIFLYGKLKGFILREDAEPKGKLAAILNGKYSFWFWLLLIILSWIPAFLATYPGIYSYDAYPQVLQILGGEGLSAHHPLIHTFLLNGCLYAGHWLTGDYNTGMLIYTVVQIFFMASVFSYALDRMKVYKISLFIRVLSYLFLAFSPINQIWVCLTTKDTIFGGLLLLVFLDIVDMVLDSEVFYSSKYRLARFIVLGIFMCLFRNQGIYLIFLAAPFLIWALKGYRKKCALVLFAVVLSTKIFTGPISSWMGAKPANPREALSVPIQQIARVLVQEPDSVTDEEKEIIYRYLPEEYISQYNASVSDAVKEGFNAKYFKENPMPFFKVWASVGLRNFSAYVDSFLYGSCGYFYTDYSPYWVQFILYDGSWTSEEFNFLKIERNTLFPAYDNYLRKVSTELIQEKIPVVSVILNEAFPFLTLIFVGGYLFYIKRYKLLLPLLVIFGFWGTNLLGPVIVMRYAFPIVICVPSMVSLIFIQQKDKRLLLSKEKGKERL